MFHSKAPKNTEILPLQKCKKNQQTVFFLYGTSFDFNFRNNLKLLGSFAKVSIPVETIIPCTMVDLNKYTRQNYIHLLKRYQTKTNTCLVYTWSCLIINEDALLPPLTDVKKIVYVRPAGLH